MWLLSTDHAELHEFADPGGVDGGYAILSHTWTGDEETFQQVQAINRRCKWTLANPRNFVSEKIRRSCLVAESYGYRWIWIDSCCINKESSTELSEAINSMFRWYERSEVCFVFLADVPTDCALDVSGSAFWKSRWHTRGWTLQELIAPNVIIFLSQTWDRIGTKVGLAHILGKIAHMPRDVLTRDLHYSHCSVAERMYWASHRRTTRVEDRAYSLMGLFDVNMPTIYGEGERAFLRLQMEIMRSSPDTSLFAWGTKCSQKAYRERAMGPDPQGVHLSNMDIQRHLLAPSPDFFRHPIFYTPELMDPERGSASTREQSAQNDSRPDDEQPQAACPFGSELPSFVVSTRGVECKFPIIETQGFKVAVLMCQTPKGANVGLLLHRSGSRDETLPWSCMYTGSNFCAAQPPDGTNHFPVYRLIHLGNDLRCLKIGEEEVKASWQTVHIEPFPHPSLSPERVLGNISFNCVPGPFRMPHWLMARFTSLGYQLYDKDPFTTETRVVIENTTLGDCMFLDIGLCQHSHTAWKSPGEPWAAIRFRDHSHIPRAVAQVVPIEHDCNLHHINSWGPTRTMAFQEPDRTIRLAFTPDGVCSSTLVIHIELGGSFYEELLRDRRVTIPTCEQLEGLTPKVRQRGVPFLNDSLYAMGGWATTAARHLCRFLPPALESDVDGIDEPQSEAYIDKFPFIVDTHSHMSI